MRKSSLSSNQKSFTALIASFQPQSLFSATFPCLFFPDAVEVAPLFSDAEAVTPLVFATAESFSAVESEFCKKFFLIKHL